MALQSKGVIRIATQADLGPLVELAALTCRETYGELLDAGEIEDYIAEHFTSAVFGAVLRDPSSTLMVSADAARLIGYAHLCISQAPACVTGETPIELRRLYLRRDAIGRGHGAALMEAANAEARRRGCKTMWLLIYDGNVRARQFYVRSGFVQVGTKEFLFGGRFYADPVLCAPAPSA